MSTRRELDALAHDLADEQASLDGLVASIDESAWHRDTPAAGWTVLDQIAHLAYFDHAATVAILDPDAFRASLEALADAAAAERLRVTFTAAHTEAQVDALSEALGRVCRAVATPAPEAHP